MEIQKTSRSNASRLQVVAGGKRGNAAQDSGPADDPGIVCRYGVVVQHTDVAGLDLVEFEFSDAA
ncbi:MAG TPA: hypothetical protein VEI74_05795 [Candidatus Methylomirabilis sp.]|nr:hypothetical protein [Candidatus Methylomirabilis sp.]